MSLKVTARKSAMAAAASAAFFVFFAKFALALSTGLDKSAKAAGYTTGKTVDIALIVGKILNPLLGLLGVVFLVLIIYAGFLYMTSQGNPETLKKARGMIVNAAVGLIIIMASYAITTFVVQSAFNTTQNTGGTTSASPTSTDSGETSDSEEYDSGSSQ